MSDRSLFQKVFNSAEIGFSLRAISIIDRGITGSAILLGLEAIITFGIFGGVGYALAGTLAMIILAPLAKKIKSDLPNGQTISDYFQLKLPDLGYWVMIFYLIMTTVSILCMQIVAGGMMVYAIFDIPSSIGMFLTYIFCILLSCLRRSELLTKLTLARVFFIFTVAFILPLYFFLREGAEHIYKGIRLYHPYLLVTDNKDVLYFFVLSFLIVLGKAIMDSKLWQYILVLDKRESSHTFVLSGVIWGTLPLSFSSLVLIVIFTGGFQNINTIYYDLLHGFDSTFLLSLFVIGAFSAISSTFVIEFDTLTKLWKMNLVPRLSGYAEQKMSKAGNYIAVFISGIALCLSIYLNLSLLNAFFYFGILFVSVLLPMIVIICSKEKVSNLITLSVLVCTTLGFILLQNFGYMKGLFICALTSTLLNFSILVSTSLLKNRKEKYK
ncbi:Na+/proline symporter [Paenibacillus sp. yr247]|uniref:hypothetical protein n=1 Tax=Paenibacillus sp. yr247 TaxID=1761880 RepID=UPI00088C5FAB|nr:hypothetical protein [Paenibacillus sp. yr247]SDO23674.1 Na+/proline symporter [Paenibacillus sp. yr247]